MNGQQQLVGVGAVSLLLVNFWTTDARHVVAAGAFNSSASADTTGAAHTYLKRYAGALLGVAALTLIAGQSPTASKAALAIVASLWLLWLILHLGGSTPATAAPTSAAHAATAAPGAPSHSGVIASGLQTAN